MSYARMYCMSDTREPAPTTKKKSDKKDKKPTRSRIRIRTLLLLLAALMLTAWWQVDRAASTDRTDQFLESDLKQLWQLTNSYFDDGNQHANWSIRWEFATTSLVAQTKLIDALFPDDKKHGAIPKRITNNGKTITGTLSELGQIAIHKVEETDYSQTLMIVWNYQAEKELLTEDKLLHAAKKIQDAITQYSATPTVAVKLQGEAHKDWIKKDWDRLTQAEQLQAFTEADMKSVLYFTPNLKSYAWLKDGYKANMQISLKQHTETKKHTLTVGVPAISGEF